MNLFECIDVELAANIAHLNGRTNTKVLNKEEQKTWKLKYESTARTCVRMFWLCNFVCHILHELIHSPEKEFVPICQEAYQTHFAPNHTWIVRKLAGQAMKFVGTREQIRVAWELQTFD